MVARRPHPSRADSALAKAVGYPLRFEIDGFTCVRVALSDRFLPASDRSCTGGSRQVTFHRS